LEYNGKIWRKWKIPQMIFTPTWTSSIFHILCSTTWTNSSSVLEELANWPQQKAIILHSC
jgi:hypothetical protein